MMQRMGFKNKTIKMVQLFSTLFVLMLVVSSCKKEEGISEEDKLQMEQNFADWADTFEAELAKFYTAQTEAYFTASVYNTTENWEKFAEADKKMNAFLAYKGNFDSLKKYKYAKVLNDITLMRRMKKIFLLLSGNQVDVDILHEMSDRNSQIEKKYGAFRALVGDKNLSDNEIEDILQNSKDSEYLQKTWEAHKEIGPVVKDDIIELVKIRNIVANNLGYDNYHTMSLTLSEQDPNELEALFDELDRLTRDAFIDVKKEIDEVLAAKYGITVEELMPWHYQNRYFQEAPKIFEVDLDKYYENQDVVELAKNYYASVGMPIDAMLDKSDLYERAETGKNQHAYCIDIDRDKKDIRVLCNVKNNTSWMETMLHEFGHALYNYHPRESLPWILKEQAHIFTTEAVAMFFGRMATNPNWMKEMLDLKDEEIATIEETCRKQELHRQLVFSRWVQVMYRFEKAMYANPEQDLNKLWWDLVEKYQMIKKPAERNMPDWATKIHIATAPCYYHNYLLGELLASQFHYTLCKRMKIEDPTHASFTGSKEIANFFINEIFQPGAFYEWNDMIEKATGEKLTPRFYAKQYVK